MDENNYLLREVRLLPVVTENIAIVILTNA